MRKPYFFLISFLLYQQVLATINKQHLKITPLSFQYYPTFICIRCLPFRCIVLHHPRKYFSLQHPGVTNFTEAFGTTFLG